MAVVGLCFKVQCESVERAQPPLISLFIATRRYLPLSTSFINVHVEQFCFYWGGGAEVKSLWS